MTLALIMLSRMYECQYQRLKQKVTKQVQVNQWYLYKEKEELSEDKNATK